MLIVCEKPCVVEGRKDGRVDGWMGGKAGLRIAYSNQKYDIITFKFDIFVKFDLFC